MTKILQKLIEKEVSILTELSKNEAEVLKRVQKMCNFEIENCFWQPSDGLCVLVCEANQNGFTDNNYTVETIVETYEELGRKINQDDIIGL